MVSRAGSLALAFRIDQMFDDQLLTFDRAALAAAARQNPHCNSTVAAGNGLLILEMNTQLAMPSLFWSFNTASATANASTLNCRRKRAGASHTWTVLSLLRCVENGSQESKPMSPDLCCSSVRTVSVLDHFVKEFDSLGVVCRQLALTNSSHAFVISSENPTNARLK